jgi:hypothetical protein
MLMLEEDGNLKMGTALNIPSALSLMHMCQEGLLSQLMETAWEEDENP